MKKNRKIISILLVVMTVLILGSTVFISGLLSSPVSPTQIQKTKAAAKTYTRTVVIPDFVANPTEGAAPTTAPLVENTPTPIPTVTKAPTSTPALLAQAPTSIPTSVPTKVPTLVPTSVPTQAMEPSLTPKPTLQPLLAYKSTSISPTLIPIANTGGMADPTKAPASPSPTKKAQPTGIQKLPETGWIQTSSILFIVAASTILFSLLF